MFLMKKCPSTEKTTAGLNTTHGIDIPLKGLNKDRVVLQRLAKEVAELAAQPIELE